MFFHKNVAFSVFFFGLFFVLYVFVLFCVGVDGCVRVCVCVCAISLPEKLLKVSCTNGHVSKTRSMNFILWYQIKAKCVLFTKILKTQFCSKCCASHINSSWQILQIVTSQYGWFGFSIVKPKKSRNDTIWYISIMNWSTLHGLMGSECVSCNKNLACHFLILCYFQQVPLNLHPRFGDRQQAGCSANHQ